MKRLRRFNESKEEIDYDYIYQCFAELIDDEKAEIHKQGYGFDRYVVPTSQDQSNKYIIVNIKTKSYPDSRALGKTELIEKSPFLNHIEILKYNYEIMQEVQVSLMRLSEEYPNYRINVSVFATSIHINIFSGEEKEEQYPF
jgi:hypothetical protein